MVQQVAEKVTDTLKECSTIAKKVYRENMNFRHELEQLLENLQNQLNDKYDSFMIDPYAKNFDFSKMIETMIKKINNQTSSGLGELTEALNQKRKHLNSFTISLFGRTKAGKSTIREALTAGTGETIGKGAQRTTRDIRQYDWNGLRLLDVPGFEAFKGDDDTEKAHEILDQSDMILFLTSDDSVQPGEFDEMSRIQELNKHFIVVMNVKHNLLELETGQPDEREIRRFLKKPEKVFDYERLNEHHKHIRSYVKKHLNIDNVEVIWIHAQSAFLSTREELNEVSDKLWETSMLDKVYDRIIGEINRSGKHRRVLTFYDSTIHFIDTLEKMLWEEQNLIRSQTLFMKEKKVELKNFFNRFIPESNKRIEKQAQKLYAPLQQWVPYFVEEYIGKKDAHSVLEVRIKEKSKQIENSMNDYMKEIISDLQTQLSEFTRQYQYDTEAIQFDQSNIGDFRKGQIGKIIKWSGITVGAISTAVFIGTANIWNPVGLALLGVSGVAGIFSGFMKNYESKKLTNAKSEAKQNLLEHIKTMESKTISGYRSNFNKNIAKKVKSEILDKVEGYIEELFFISDQLKEKAAELDGLKEKLNKHLFAHMLRLEGFTCQPSDLKSIAREQGVATKIVVPLEWNLDSMTRTGLDQICGEHVTLLSDDSDLRGLVAKAIYPAKIKADQVKIIDDGKKMTVQVTVPTSTKGLAIGKQGMNIRLAQKLCNVKIELV
ncbi:50S ribosome-binding GTPase [Neobacillus bataviensis]|uniref:50S ribosome-binding GTPase n=1 Tax=Neobacillus bataviensis TaxID=220685 RepID=A0A561CLV8_9BACI|nr:GTPase [Neobacillus bataviensis]TWD92215.1 50S ribosome-binding GTPase [Neobacillus bataviensis]